MDLKLLTDGDMTMPSGKAFQILITRLEKKLLSRAEYTSVLVSYIESPLVRSIHEREKKIITIKIYMYPVMQNLVAHKQISFNSPAV